MTNRRNTDINGLAQEFTFGVEIETVISQNKARDHNLIIGGYRQGNQVPYLPEGWTASFDASIRRVGDNQACEIVSPVLKGEAGIKELIKVIRILKAKGHKVNPAEFTSTSGLPARRRES